jgi:hypothetical protein
MIAVIKQKLESSEMSDESGDQKLRAIKHYSWTEPCPGIELAVSSKRFTTQAFAASASTALRTLRRSVLDTARHSGEVRLQRPVAPLTASSGAASSSSYRSSWTSSIAAAAEGGARRSFPRCAQPRTSTSFLVDDISVRSSPQCGCIVS